MKNMFSARAPCGMYLFLILTLLLEARLCIISKSIKIVRLSVDKMAGAIGLVEGVSFTQVRLKSMQKGSLNFAIFSCLNTTIWYHSSSSLKGNYFVIK